MPTGDHTRRACGRALWTVVALVAGVLVVSWLADPPDRVVAQEIDGRTWLSVRRPADTDLVLANGVSGLVEAEADVAGTVPDDLRFGGSDGRFTVLAADGEAVVVADGTHAGSVVELDDGATSVLGGGGLLTAGTDVSVRSIATDGTIGEPAVVDDAGTPVAGVAPVVDGDGYTWVLTDGRRSRSRRPGRQRRRPLDVDPDTSGLLVVDGRAFAQSERGARRARRRSPAPGGRRARRRAVGRPADRRSMGGGERNARSRSTTTPTTSSPRPTTCARSPCGSATSGRRPTTSPSRSTTTRSSRSRVSTVRSSCSPTAGGCGSSAPMVRSPSTATSKRRCSGWPASTCRCAPATALPRRRRLPRRDHDDHRATRRPTSRRPRCLRPSITLPPVVPDDVDHHDRAAARPRSRRRRRRRRSLRDPRRCRRRRPRRPATTIAETTTHRPLTARPTLPPLPPPTRATRTARAAGPAPTGRRPRRRPSAAARRRRRRDPRLRRRRRADDRLVDDGAARLRRHRRSVHRQRWRRRRRRRRSGPDVVGCRRRLPLRRRRARRGAGVGDASTSSPVSCR